MIWRREKRERERDRNAADQGGWLQTNIDPFNCSGASSEVSFVLYKQITFQLHEHFCSSQVHNTRNKKELF